MVILQRPTPTPPPLLPTEDQLLPNAGAATNQGPSGRTSSRFASPPITLRRSRSRTTPQPWTLGEFLATATKHLNAALPAPGKKPRRPLNFAPRRGRSAATTCQPSAPPTAERRAHVQILRTLGIIGIDQKITAAEMKAYDGMFAAPLPLTVLKAIATLVDREIPVCMAWAATGGVDVACEG